MIREAIWRIFPPYECTVVKNMCRTFLKEHSDLGRHIIAADLYSYIRRNPNYIVNAIRIDHQNAEHAALSLITSTIGILLGSGNHHRYRNVLSMTGEDMLKTWKSAISRMVEANYIDNALAADLRANLKEDIRTAG